MYIRKKIGLLRSPLLIGDSTFNAIWYVYIIMMLIMRSEDLTFKMSRGINEFGVCSEPRGVVSWS